MSLLMRARGTQHTRLSIVVAPTVLTRWIAKCRKKKVRMRESILGSLTAVAAVQTCWWWL